MRGSSLTLAVACWMTFLAEFTSPVAAQETSNAVFSARIAPFLNAHCLDCHTGDDAEGQTDLQSLTPDFTTDARARRWIDVLQNLQFDQMPPPESDQPDAKDRAEVTGWILNELNKTGRYEGYRKKLLAPEYGNWVSHEKLFSGDIKTPPFSPARIWRYSPAIFTYRGLGNAKSPFTFMTSERGIRDYASISVADQSTVQMMLIAADSFLADRQRRGEFDRYAAPELELSDQQLKDILQREFFRVIGRNLSEAEIAKYLAFCKQNISTGGNLEGIKTTIKAMFLSTESMFRMELGRGPVDQHGRRQLSSDEIAYSLAYALTDHPPERNHLIRDAWKSDKLKNKQDVEALVQQIMDQQLTTGRWEHRDLPRVMRFFEEYFGFHRAGNVFKDNDRRRREKINQWNTNMLVHDAKMLIEHVLRQDQDVIAELLTTNQYFIAHPGNNQYAKEYYDEQVAKMTAPGYVEEKVQQRREQLQKEVKDWQLKKDEAERRLESYRKTEQLRVERYKTAIAAGMNPHPSYPFAPKSRGIGDLLYIEPYNLPSSGSADEQKWDWPLEQPLAMPKNQRAGLLTHPAWLAAHSLNEDNDPIRRGIWVYERLLAGVLGDVPPDVDAAVPSDPHQTLRQRMQNLRDQRCWKCHRKINPLGETFEIFDDWGRYRNRIYFDQDGKVYHRRDGDFERRLEANELTTRPVDASGMISGSGDPNVDGPVQDAVEMMHRLGHSQRARQSFIRHLFRYLMGRNEMLSDSQTLIAAEQAYLANGGSFKALVVSLLSSDSFLYRR
ncbi:hypothetical protein SV7mr_48370 [Stieleria bergensis]|uniref:Planctomycete cytochrome C n=2 Tax=Stieleria bergensis TaxID=2528025 RepID=A0A517T1N6_9BACT|nr:hypothetical protein SV7mr_48370 [Planctomycetes bacterium SV_7m_r]